MPRNIAASKICNGVISLLWQLQCHCIPDHDKFSSLSNKTVVAVFPNVCLWRRSYSQNWEVLSVKNCYSVEPPSYVTTAYVVASYGPLFLSTVRFFKIWAICEKFLGKSFTAPPGKNFPYAYDFRYSVQGLGNASLLTAFLKIHFLLSCFTQDYRMATFFCC